MAPTDRELEGAGVLEDSRDASEDWGGSDEVGRSLLIETGDESGKIPVDMSDSDERGDPDDEVGTPDDIGGVVLNA